MTGLYKSSLAEIETDDKIILQTSDGHLNMLPVIRTTATQIIAGGQRYRKDDGKEVGGGASYYSDFIYAPLSKDEDGRQWLHRYEQYAQKQAESRKKQPYINFILNDLRSSALRALSLEDLQEAAKKLGYRG